MSDGGADRQALAEFYELLGGHGWKFVPLIPQGKYPSIEAWQHRDTPGLPVAGALARLAGDPQAGNGVGCVPPVGGLCVDCDSPEAVAYVEQFLNGVGTTTAHTPRLGGRHYYFIGKNAGMVPQGAGLAKATEAGGKIDTRTGETGQTVGPGSYVVWPDEPKKGIKAGAGVYTVWEILPLRDCPAELATVLSRGSGQAPGSKGIQTARPRPRPALQAPPGEVEEEAVLEPGRTYNNDLYAKAALKMAASNVVAPDVEAFFVDLIMRYTNPPWPEREALRVVRAALGQFPERDRYARVYTANAENDVEDLHNRFEEMGISIRYDVLGDVLEFMISEETYWRMDPDGDPDHQPQPGHWKDLDGFEHMPSSVCSNPSRSFQCPAAAWALEGPRWVRAHAAGHVQIARCG